jgi:tryptophan synthase alpha subunit
MSRIAATFAALKAKPQGADPYVTAGFPYADITPR